VVIFHETHRALASSAVGCERLKFFRFVRGKLRERCLRRNSAIGRIVSPLNFSEMAANGSECRDIHKARVTNGSSRLRVTLFVKLRVRVSLGIDRACALRDAREIFATLSRKSNSRRKHLEGKFNSVPLCRLLEIPHEHSTPPLARYHPSYLHRYAVVSVLEFGQNPAESSGIG